MTGYAVELTHTALDEITEHLRYIAIEAQAPQGAQRWLEGVWDGVDSLERFPWRGRVARESRHLAYEVRVLVIGSHRLLYTVDDDRQVVWIVGLRHGRRLPRPEALPEDPADDETRL